MLVLSPSAKFNRKIIKEKGQNKALTERGEKITADRTKVCSMGGGGGGGGGGSVIELLKVMEHVSNKAYT